MILYSLGIMTGILLAVLQNWHNISCRTQARTVRTMRRELDAATKELNAITHMIACGSSVGQPDYEPAPPADAVVLPLNPPLNSHVPRETLTPLPSPPPDDREYFTALRLQEDPTRLETWAQRDGMASGAAAIAYAASIAAEPDTTSIPQSERRAPKAFEPGWVNPMRRRADRGDYPTFTPQIVREDTNA